MKKHIKSGFTLAEILIALGIAGVIAALAIPSVTINMQKKNNAIALGKNIQVVESGCANIIQHANSASANDDFFGIYNAINGNNLWTGTESFFNNRVLSNNDITNYKLAVKAYDGSTASPAADSLFGNALVMNQKTGAYLGNKGINETANYEDPIIGYLYVDVNGANPPNRYGNDIFVLGLTDACHAIPAGSSRLNTINKSLPTEANGCSGNNVTNGLSCTSRVIKEGYKISY